MTGPKQYSAEQIRLFQKVLNGAPLGPDCLVPFSLNEVVNPLEEVHSLLKDDESRTSCCVLASSIDHETAGNGLYAGSNFDEGHVLGKYWGCIALILDSEIPYFQWFGHINRALLLKAQPFLKTELGPAKLYIIGSKNCALSYMNTIQEDTVFVEGCQTQFFHKKDLDFYCKLKSALNVIFEEVRCPDYNEQSKTFPSFEAFITWLFNGPTQGVLTSPASHAEEVYACYYKEYPWAQPKRKSNRK